MMHKMVEISDGIFECPECGRKMVLEFEPFSRTVLEPGDEMEQHVASRGLNITSVEVSAKDYLAPFRDWIGRLS